MKTTMLLTAAGCALASLAHSARAQEPADTLAHLRDQLQLQRQHLAQALSQLEQLQQRIALLESSRKAQPRAGPEATSATPSATGPATLAAPGTAGPTALLAGDLPRSIKLGATSVAVTGLMWSVGSVSSRSAGPGAPGDDFLILSQIPVGPGSATASHDKFKLGAKASRLGVKTLTPSRLGPVSTLLELDFLGGQGNEVATNSYVPRLRHAWLSVGDWGAGQTWSNLLNLSAAPELLDPAPPIGWFGGGVRQAQLRWTSPLAADGSFWAVSAENPETHLGTSALQDNDRWPDLTAKTHLALGRGQFELAGVWRRLGSANPGSASASAYGLGFGGAMPLSASTTLQFSTGAGRGLGRYWGAIVADATVSEGASRTLQAIHQTGGFVALRQAWTPTLRSNVVGSWLSMRPARIHGSSAPLDRRAQTWHLNLVWTPLPGLDVGLELLRARRELVNGEQGGLTRYLLGVKYLW